MKKHLLALAALATVSSVAVAQNVTIYGFLDAGLYSTNNGDSSNGKRLTTAANGGGNWFPSMLGFTGSEDLGGGLKANFNLQSSLMNNSGAVGDGVYSNFFDRYASVGLSGSAGKLDLGKQLDIMFLQSFVNGVIPTHANSLAVDGLLAYGGGNTTLGNGGSTNAVTAGSRVSNAITYETPTLNGVKAQLQYSVGGVAGSTSANSAYAGIVSYSVAGVSLNAGYESQNAATAAGGTDVYKKGLIAAKTSIGAIDLAAQFHNYKNKNATATVGGNASDVNVNAYEIGAAYHVSPNLLVGVNYEAFDNKAANVKPTVTSLKAKYDFSKRTYAYTMLSRYNSEAFNTGGLKYQAYVVGAGKANESTTGLAVGIVHGF